MTVAELIRELEQYEKDFGPDEDVRVEYFDYSEGRYSYYHVLEVQPGMIPDRCMDRIVLKIN